MRAKERAFSSDMRASSKRKNERRLRITKDLVEGVKLAFKKDWTEPLKLRQQRNVVKSTRASIKC
jgi:hypothetical protein